MKTGDKVIVNDKGRFTPDYANVDISRMEMKHGKEVVAMALEEYLKESGASEHHS